MKLNFLVKESRTSIRSPPIPGRPAYCLGPTKFRIALFKTKDCKRRVQGTRYTCDKESLSSARSRCQSWRPSWSFASSNQRRWSGVPFDSHFRSWTFRLLIFFPRKIKVLLHTGRKSFGHSGELAAVGNILNALIDDRDRRRHVCVLSRLAHYGLNIRRQPTHWRRMKT